MKRNYFMYYQPIAVLIIIGISSIIMTILYRFGWTYLMLGFLLILGLLELIDLCLWKHPILSWIVTVEDFSGTYTGKQECFVIEKEESCKKKRVLIDVKFIITQTASNIHVNASYTYHGKESSNSYSNLCLITKTKDKQHFKITYQYTNEGNASVLDRHNGTCIIKVKKNNGNYILDGNYYTDRKPFPTQGNFSNLKRESKNPIHSY